MRDTIVDVDVGYLYVIDLQMRFHRKSFILSYFSTIHLHHKISLVRGILSDAVVPTKS